MNKRRKIWMWLAAGFVPMLVVLALVLSQASRAKAAPSLSPPPGPHQAGDVWVADLGGKTTMEMVWCPPGKFLAKRHVFDLNPRPYDGPPPPGMSIFEKNEKPQPKTMVDHGFWLGKCEVTQKQWLAVMGTMPSTFPQKTIVYWKVWKWQVPVWRKDFLVSRRDLPVDSVNWDDCQEFCRRAGDEFHIPNDIEWEYACRAGSTGSTAGTGVLQEMGWFQGNGGGKIHPVGKKHPNAWGLQDMHGNVWEWNESVTDSLFRGLEQSADYDRDKWYGFTLHGGCCWSDSDLCDSGLELIGGSGCKSEFPGLRVAYGPSVLPKDEPVDKP